MRTRFSEKVGTRLTIITATKTSTTALSTQFRGQPSPTTNDSIIGASARPAAAGAGMPVKKK